MKKRSVLILIMILSMVVSMLSVAAESTSGSFPAEYRVTYVAGSGGTLNGDTEEWVTEGEHPQTPPNPVATGILYKFSHWEDQDGIVYDDPKDYVVYETTTFTAVFVLNSGLIGPGFDTDIGELDVMVDQGLVFIPQMPQADETIYSVIYSGGLYGGLAGVEMEFVVNGGHPTNPPSVVPDPGYTFIGWSDGDQVLMDATEFVITGHTSIWANYEGSANRRVWFNGGDFGSIEGDTFESVPYGTAPLANVVITADDGYDFIGWSDGTSLYEDISQYAVEVDTTFTAVYEVSRNQTVTVFYDSAFAGYLEGVNHEEIPAGTSAANVPIVHPDEGYVFAGWTIMGEVIDPTSYIFEADTRLFPKLESAAEGEVDNQEEQVADGDQVGDGSGGNDAAESEQEADNQNDAEAPNNDMNDQDTPSDTDQSSDEDSDQTQAASEDVGDNQDQSAEAVTSSDEIGSDENDMVGNDDEKNAEKNDNTMLIVIIIAAMVILIVVLAILLLSKKKEDKSEKPAKADDDNQA